VTNARSITGTLVHWVVRHVVVWLRVVVTILRVVTPWTEIVSANKMLKVNVVIVARLVISTLMRTTTLAALLVSAMDTLQNVN
jgi:hypothetical protein